MAESNPNQDSVRVREFTPELMQQLRELAQEFKESEALGSESGPPERKPDDAPRGQQEEQGQVQVQQQQRSGSSGMFASTPPRRTQGLGDLLLPGKGEAKMRELAEAGELSAQGPGGFIPSMFGGRLNWQMVAKMAGSAGKSAMEKQDRDGTSGGFFGGVRKVGQIGEFFDQHSTETDTVLQIMRKAKDKSAALEGTGGALGATPGRGFGSSFGPMRLPFINPAARKGIAAGFDSTVKAGLTPGISIKEDMNLKNMVAGMGYVDGSDKAKGILGDTKAPLGLDALGFLGGEEMSGLRELQQFNPDLLDPEMVEKVTRNADDSTLALNNMVKAMKDINDTAKTSGVSIEQMVSSMNQAGEAAAETGGTFAEGSQGAAVWTQQTGLSPDLYNTMMDNSLVQSRLYRDTGVMPQHQGALGNTTKTLGAINSMEEQLETVGNFGTQTIRDEDGNVIDQVTGRDHKAAIIADQYDLTQDEARNMLGRDGDFKRFKKGIGVRTKGHGAAALLSNAMESIDNKGEITKFARRNLTMAEGTLDASLQDAKDAVDHEGNKMYDEEDIEKMEAAGGSMTAYKAGDASDDQVSGIAKWFEKHGGGPDKGDMSDEEYVEAMLKGEDGDFRERQYMAAHEAQAYEGGLTKEEKKRTPEDPDRGGRTVVDLSEDAKRFFRIQPNSNSVRDHGGSSSVNNFFDPRLKTDGITPSE